MAAKAKFKLNEAALNTVTTQDTGRILDAMYDRFNQEFQQQCSARAGGVHWATRPNVILGGGRSQLTVTIPSNSPRVIVPRSARVLVFDVNGQTAYAHSVNHPGSSPPVEIVRDVIDTIDSDFTSIAAGAT